MPDSVLIVDDEPNIRILCAETLKAEGYEVHTASGGAEAVEFLESSPVDVVLTDLKMPGMTGLQLLQKVRQDYEGVDVILMTAHATVASAVDALKQGAYDYILKPFSVDDLASRLRRLGEKRELVAINRLLGDHVNAGRGPGGLVGTSSAMRQVYRCILKVARCKQPVLITGETGTGKELVARAIHELGPHPDNPFVAVDCAALSPTLIESELFGHVAGAFTGAAQRREGLLGSAQQGTLFLDEVGELPLAMQAKLLRTLQEREFRAVGSNRAEPLAARVIAATNRNLEESVENGEFRSDLYFRLNVFSIHLPPLRDRKADIPALVRCFLEDAGDQENAATSLSRGAMNELLKHSWPGNVRELRNQVERAAALSEGAVIQAADLAPQLRSGFGDEQAARGLTYLEELERRGILEMLDAAGGNKINAAKLLGISRTTLYKKMRVYGLEDHAAPEL